MATNHRKRPPAAARRLRASVGGLVEAAMEYEDFVEAVGDDEFFRVTSELPNEYNVVLAR